MKIAVSGLSGRMGQALQEVSSEYANHSIVYGLGRESNPKKPPIFTRFSDSKLNVEILVDISSPEFLLNLIHECPPTIKGIVTGTTGFSQTQFNELKSFAKNKFIFHANNFSIGIYAMIKCIESMGPLLNQWDVLLKDIHHVHKKDSPSGTAKWMLQTLKSAGGPTDPNVESLRVGETTGEHTLTFSQAQESFTLSHTAHDRKVFIHGIFEILNWIERENCLNNPGFYGMEDYFQSISPSAT
jgi:4-hydroxy-tetrahydrodipicolinate reductase